MRETICYWDQGVFFFESDPITPYRTEAAMMRKSNELGFTHVVVKHGYYLIGKGFIEGSIEPHRKRIPKRYRQVRHSP